MLGIEAEEIEPADADQPRSSSAELDLLWFGGIGTYIKARGESHAEVGDPGNDAIRVNAAELRVKAIGEGANLGITQAGADRVQPAWRPDQHRLHRQFAPASIARTTRSTSRSR